LNELLQAFGSGLMMLLFTLLIGNYLGDLLGARSGVTSFFWFFCHPGVENYWLFITYEIGASPCFSVSITERKGWSRKGK